ncbi:hypothetical protein FA95DRAFT_1559201 [Auriscalpium vulgare]|uniref:Uncharacterized protein n=1 Tax=Auriscalpium vulgare TaxID=40419 RepID=A0ACB8RU17_9AGAM|nr:hypothetical protein FA95DRAFT_1559201 [Auriscalpium vulgare]
MGDEFATRLMIVKGNFEKLSMAIYGDLVAEPALPPTSYTPSLLPTSSSTPLTPSLDPANHADPTALARALLQLIPDAPPLPLVIRLMFCLKPKNEDWDLPQFPYLHPDLTLSGIVENGRKSRGEDKSDDDGEGGEGEDVVKMEVDFDLEDALSVTRHPVADDVAYEVLQGFVDRVVGVVGPKSETQAYLVSGILSQVAAQHPDFSRLLVGRLDIRDIFDASTMDEDTLDRLLIAAANPDVARALVHARLGPELVSIEHNPVSDMYTRRAAHRLKVRLQAWDELSAALSNSDASPIGATALLHEIGTDEPAFGVLLHAFVTHTDLVTKLEERPAVPGAILAGKSGTRDDFVAYLRAWIGVACVLAVYAWADSLPNPRCRERCFGVMRVWQETKGYRKILNQLLLLRQMLFRLECMMDDDTPTHAGIHAEHILHALAHSSPTALLSDHLIKSLLSLQPGLSAINDDARQDLRDLALLADDGLPGAVEELTRPLESPLTPHAVQMLRVALAMIGQELEEGEEGEWRTLNVLWDQEGHGLTMHLLDALKTFVSDIQSQFGLGVPPPASHTLLAELFLAANDLMGVLGRLVPVYPLPGREARAFVEALADLYSSAEAAAAVFAGESDVSAAAQATRQTSIAVLRSYGSSPAFGELIMRTLLRYGAPSGHRDPVLHLHRILAFIDHFLPTPGSPDVKDAVDNAGWVRRAIPHVLTDLTAFHHLLDPPNKVLLVRRLAELDQGVLGVGEWLVLEELKRLQTSVKLLGDASAPEDLRVLRRCGVAGSLRVLQDLTSGPSDSARRMVEYVGTNAEPAALLTSTLGALLSLRLFSPLQASIAKTIVTSDLNNLNPHLAFSLALTFLRSVQHQSDPSPPLSSTISRALDALKVVPIKLLDPDKLCADVCEALITICASPGDNIFESEAESVLALLEWLVQRSHAGLPQLATLKGISGDTFSQLCDHLLVSLPHVRQDGLELVRLSIGTAPEDVGVPPFSLLSSEVKMSLHRVDALFREQIAAPTTPKRTPPHTQNVLGLVTVSPPTALLRSPAVTGLTKTYNANDFRSLRQQPSARQNTSRLPSMHVDDFESGLTSSPVLVPGGLPPVPLNAFATIPDGFVGLSAPFGGP